MQLLTNGSMAQARPAARTPGNRTSPGKHRVFFVFYGTSVFDFVKNRLAEIRIRAILLDIEKASTTRRRRAGKRNAQETPRTAHPDRNI